MAVQFSPTVLDAHIAPGVSSFTRAEIPDMTSRFAESAHWIANFYLNSAMSRSFAAPMNAYAYNFIRRAQYAFTEHELARGSTLGFLHSNGQNVRRYADALFHWEVFLGQSWHAINMLVVAWEGRAFGKDDGSVEQRLNAIYNQMKHVESRIDNNQLIAGATVPVWLTNDGLRSVDCNLSYQETGDVLEQLGKYAHALSNPETAKARLSELEA